MAGLQQDKRPLAGWRPRPPMIVAVALGVIAMTVFFDDAVVAYQTWRHGAPGIASGAAEDARSVAILSWRPAQAICQDPTVTAAELGRRRATIGPGYWDWAEDLVMQSGSVVYHQRILDPYRWDRGWVLRSVTVDGTLNSVEVERLRLDETDGPAPSTIAVYDGDCRLVGASLSEQIKRPDGSRAWQERCFDWGWVDSDCTAIEERLETLVDVSGLPLKVVERQCYDNTLSPFDWCPTDVQTVSPSIGRGEGDAPGL